MLWCSVAAGLMLLPYSPSLTAAGLAEAVAGQGRCRPAFPCSRLAAS